MEIDPVKIIEKFSPNAPKQNVTLKIRPGVYKAFQDLLVRKGVKIGPVIEEFMREACEKMGQPIAGGAKSSSALGRIVDRLSALDESELAALADQFEAQYPSVVAPEEGRKPRQQRK